MDAVALRVSLSLAMATVLVLLPLGIWAGHALAIHTFRGKAFVEALVAVPLILPPTVLAPAANREVRSCWCWPEP